ADVNGTNYVVSASYNPDGSLKSLLNGSTVVSSSKVSYDKLWRRSQASNPFGPNETPVNTAFSYDALGRSKQVTPPSGGFTQYDYSGNTVPIISPTGLKPTPREPEHGLLVICLMVRH